MTTRPSYVSGIICHKSPTRLVVTRLRSTCTTVTTVLRVTVLRAISSELDSGKTIFIRTATPVSTPLAETAIRRKRRSEEHTSELQSQSNIVCRLLLEKKKKSQTRINQHDHDN